MTVEQWQERTEDNQLAIAVQAAIGNSQVSNNEFKVHIIYRNQQMVPVVFVNLGEEWRELGEIAVTQEVWQLSLFRAIRADEKVTLY